MSKFFNNNKILSLALTSTLVFIIYTALILSRVSGCFTLEVGSNSLGLSFSYNIELVQSFFDSRSQEQLICYGEFLKIWDIIFAVVYTTMYASWIALLLKNKHLYLIIPILAMICDWSENYLEILMLESYLQSNLIPQNLVSLGSGINSFKWILSSLTYLVILLGILFVLKNLLKKNKKNLT